jgi:hypothetical protein
VEKLPGGTVSTIWLYTMADRSVIKVPQLREDARHEPMWIGERYISSATGRGIQPLFLHGSGEDIRQHTALQIFRY